MIVDHQTHPEFGGREHIVEKIEQNLEELDLEQVLDGKDIDEVRVTVRIEDTLGEEVPQELQKQDQEQQNKDIKYKDHCIRVQCNVTDSEVSNQLYKALDSDHIKQYTKDTDKETFLIMYSYTLSTVTRI